MRGLALIAALVLTSVPAAADTRLVCADPSRLSSTHANCFHYQTVIDRRAELVRTAKENAQHWAENEAKLTALIDRQCERNLKRLSDVTGRVEQGDRSAGSIRAEFLPLYERRVATLLQIATLTETGSECFSRLALARDELERMLVQESYQ